ncbi:MAG: 3-hydroxybutyryl-CoA dehydrogenase [Phycisphaerae bacterium]|nr:3-hydroxybutyryl-CoA dehydrogenase [Phycisphaerae bacterium]MBM92100.1 3-hydroxybutyryl-CoA dehydrogenase [Phycisphaerae bacterium]HCT44571.1 3-hydroxybutyryl-CoA dehydrogenase [Phycisphaerales bacterium]
MDHGIKTVAVIGSGQMGGGIAQVAAVSGFDTVVYDLSGDALKRCKGLHDKLLSRAVEKGRMSEDDVTAAQGRLTYADSMSAMDNADIVIEAVVEDLDVKKKIFSGLADKFTGNQILASNTSSISITALATSVGDAADRFIGMHFFNPVPVMKLVEVINGLATSEETTARTIALSDAMGKVAVPANDRAGFVSNRVLMPMINEAFYAWMEGVAEPEHIDEIMKLGMAHPMGPLRLADFIGLDTCVHIMDVLAEGLNNDRYRACPLLKQLVVAGRLGNKTGRGVFDYSK